MKFSIKSLIVILGYPLILLITEIIYRKIFNIAPLNRHIETYVIYLLLLLFLLLSKNKLTKFLVCLFFASSVIINSGHYAVYDNWINGTNYFLMFKEIGEVLHVGMSMLDRVAAPILYSVLETAIFISALFIFPQKNKIRQYYISDILFIGLFLYLFVRSFYSTQELGITSNPSYSRVKSNFFSVGNFIGKVIPYEIFDLSQVKDYFHPTPSVTSQPDVKNIIFIMGESLSAKHVNYFGYERETMPFISKLANENPNNTVLKEAYSAGLMTAISLPALFNAIPHPNGLKQIMKGDTNFFKLAKIQGFNTHFYTAQPERTMMIMSIMGKSWMDHQITPTQLGLSPDQGINDHKLLPLLQEIDLDKEKNFIVLHQRGSHGPYAEYLSEEEKIFKDGTPLDNYDSTIYNTDQLIEKVYNYLETRGKDDYVLIYTSDHGQFVTKNHYNQGTTAEDQYLVPAFIYTKNDKINQKLKQLDQCKRLFHQQLSTLVINIMGFDMPISSCEKGVINSGMITGDYGYLSVEQAKPPAFINPNRK